MIKENSERRMSIGHPPLRHCPTTQSLTRMEFSPNFYPLLDQTSGGEEGGFTTGQVEPGGGWRSDGFGQNFWGLSFQKEKGLLVFGDKSVHCMICSV